MKKPQTFITILVLFLGAFLSASEADFHVCTVANYQCHNLDILLNSAQHYGLQVEVAGLDKTYRNNFYKLFRMKEHLKNIPDQDIILFVDAFDVVLLGNKQQFIERFLSFNAPLVFSAERRLYPAHSVHDMKTPYPASSTTFRYLNSGGYIGKAGYIKIMIDEVISKRYSIPLIRYRRLQSDQFHCHRYFLCNQKSVKLDTKNKIFVTLSDVNPDELIIDEETMSVTVKETGNKPIAIHGNGPGKDLYNEIARLFFK